MSLKFKLSATLAAATLAVGSARPAHAIVYGIDVYAGNGTMNWPVIAGGGRDFTWVKATEGATFRDPATQTNETSATAAGLYIGVYHFAHPESNSPTTEANNFINYGNAVGAFSPGKLVPSLDLESGLGGAVVGASSLSAWARAWCDQVFAATGAKPVIYVNQNYAANLTSTVTSNALWLAAYNHDSSLTTGPWASATFVQYTSTGKVVGDPANFTDCDYYNGSLSSLISNYVIGGVALPAAVVPEPVSLGVAFVAPWLLLRRRCRAV